MKGQRLARQAVWLVDWLLSASWHGEHSVVFMLLSDTLAPKPRMFAIEGTSCENSSVSMESPCDDGGIESSGVSRLKNANERIVFLHVWKISVNARHRIE